MEKVLRIADVMAQTGLAKSSLYELMAAGDFPKQIRISVRSVGWIETEIEEWLESRITARRPLTVKQTTDSEREV